MREGERERRRDEGTANITEERTKKEIVTSK